MQLLTSHHQHCRSAATAACQAHRQPCALSARHHHCLPAHRSCRQAPLRSTACQLSRVSAVRAPRRRLVVSNVVMAPATTASAGHAGSDGASETSWYAWPEGYLGQAFNLEGKMEPRATGLRDDVNELTLHSTTRRMEAQFSEHTITSAEESSMMVSAVVGADVDMGLLKVGGSASFEMYQNYKSNTISHNMVASFQQNHMLEKNQLALSLEARQVLARLGPEEFKARYGTHFVCGIGYRGAFIGSINIRMQESSNSYAAGASFKASYGACSATADIKAKMKDSGIDCEVSVEWSKWGADDDELLNELEENCAEDNPSLTAIRQLAIQTADRATGYPKLIKLRPYSTLPDFVEACSQYGQPLPLLDQEPALAYLTDRYRRVAYVLSALEHEGRSGAGVNVSPLETKTRQLIAQLEEAFTCKETLAKLAAHFKDEVPLPEWAYAPLTHRLTQQVFEGGTLVREWDESVFMLDYELYKAINKPLCTRKPYPGQLWDRTQPEGGFPLLTGGGDSIHIAAASDASSTSPSGSWWLNGTQQEVWTQPGFYMVTLGNFDGVFEQIGSTQRFENTVDGGKAANRFAKLAESMRLEGGAILIAVKVGDATSKWSTNPDDNAIMTSLLRPAPPSVTEVPYDYAKDLAAGHSVAAIVYPDSWVSDERRHQATVAMRSVSDNMVLAEAVLSFNPAQFL